MKGIVLCGTHVATPVVQESAVRVMGRPVSYSIVDCPDGRFAVEAVSALGSVYRRCGFLTLAEAEQCAEDLRAIMATCGAPLVRREAELPAGKTLDGAQGT